MIDYRCPTPAEIERAQAETLAAAERIVTEIVQVADGERTYWNTLYRLEDVADLLLQAQGRYGFMFHVAEDPAVRAAAERLREALDKYSTELGFREDLYAAVSAYAATSEARALTGERARLLERVLRDYRRNGFGLPP